MNQLISLLPSSFLFARSLLFHKEPSILGPPVRPAPRRGLRATHPPQQPRPASCPLTVARQPPADFTCARLTLGSKEDRWRRATVMHAAGPLVVETVAVSRPTR